MARQLVISLGRAANATAALKVSRWVPHFVLYSLTLATQPSTPVIAGCLFIAAFEAGGIKSVGATLVEDER